ncbi:hypothetical protein GGX14DRAFT_596080 [Mycena pura]|uniref:Uncharacterized protein n=1 Tax=Mycena pura TaxID=153505 RepID=A0AAD6UQ23_9AGAR|nr:hypothetical protein GGX14DRAFT_596080 [Mycena pura]
MSVKSMKLPVPHRITARRGSYVDLQPLSHTCPDCIGRRRDDSESENGPPALTLAPPAMCTDAALSGSDGADLCVSVGSRPDLRAVPDLPLREVDAFVAKLEHAPDAPLGTVLYGHELQGPLQVFEKLPTKRNTNTTGLYTKAHLFPCESVKGYPGRDSGTRCCFEGRYGLGWHETSVKYCIPLFSGVRWCLTWLGTPTDVQQTKTINGRRHRPSLDVLWQKDVHEHGKATCPECGALKSYGTSIQNLVKQHLGSPKCVRIRRQAQACV